MPLQVSLDYMRTINPSTTLRISGERSRTIKFLTLGCKVNQYDTQSIREHFLGKGFQEIDNGKIADVYLINTCTVTHRSDAESLNLIRRAKEENPRAKIIVTGCLTELDQDRIKAISRRILIVRNREKEKFFLKGISNFKNHTRAFLKIQDGCNNSCAYCKVPLVRGPSRSRPLREVIQEAERLIEHGVKEIVLSGICLGAYGQDLNPTVNLVDVIEGLEKINALLRIRLSSIEARDVSGELIKKLAHSKKLCPHLHIPIQSGDDRILRKMKRDYTRADYSRLFAKLKSAIPGVAISTDILVGFPGESEENFQSTITLIRKVCPVRTHIFPYSERNGTAAAAYEGKINPKVIAQRIAYIREIAQECSLSYKKAFLNKKTKVLIEEQVKDAPGFWQGYSDNYIKARIKSQSNLKNQLVLVKFQRIVKEHVEATLV